MPGTDRVTKAVAEVGDWKAFSSGRNLAAWIGLVPKQHSTGGKDRLGGISHRLLHPNGGVAMVRGEYTKEAIETLRVEVWGDTKMPAGVPRRRPDCAECDYMWDRDMLEGLPEIKRETE